MIGQKEAEIARCHKRLAGKDKIREAAREGETKPRVDSFVEKAYENTYKEY